MFAFALKKQKNTQKWQVYVRNHVTHFCDRLKELAYYSVKSLIYQNPSGTPEKILTPLWQVNSLQWLATIKSKSFLESHLDFDKWAISWNNRQVLLVCHKNEWHDFWRKLVTYLIFVCFFVHEDEKKIFSLAKIFISTNVIFLSFDFGPSKIQNK